MLYRSVNAGVMQPYVVIGDLTETAYVDNAVKWNRLYCYQLRALTDTGIASAPSVRVCVRPLK